jgi:hypothetical protein
MPKRIATALPLLLVAGVVLYVCWPSNRRSPVPEEAKATGAADRTDKTATEQASTERTNFSVPFLGDIKAAKSEVHEIPLPDNKGNIKVREYFDARGRLVRLEAAEAKPVAERPSVEYIQDAYHMYNEKIFGFAEAPLRISDRGILDRLSTAVDMKNVADFNITMVRWAHITAGPPEDVIIANVYGAEYHSYRPTPDEYKRVRILFDLGGEIIFSDNML